MLPSTGDWQLESGDRGLATGPWRLAAFMPYRFVAENQDYSIYASGQVFYTLPGYPALPVRLVDEMFQRCQAVRQASGPCTIYDPCCGGAYHLSVLAYLHWSEIGAMIASDIDEEAVALARRNLSLLTIDGLERRMAEIAGRLAAYGKSSHAEALAGAEKLHQRLVELVKQHPIATHLFRADITKDSVRDRVGQRAVDMVLTDVPYGWHTSWQLFGQKEAGGPPPVWRMLETLLEVISPQTVLAIAADKGQKVAHERYRRIERFQVGKRQVVLLVLG